MRTSLEHATQCNNVMVVHFYLWEWSSHRNPQFAYQKVWRAEFFLFNFVVHHQHIKNISNVHNTCVRWKRRKTRRLQCIKGVLPYLVMPEHNHNYMLEEEKKTMMCLAPSGWWIFLIPFLCIFLSGEENNLAKFNYIRRIAIKNSLSLTLSKTVLRGKFSHSRKSRRTRNFNDFSRFVRTNLWIINKYSEILINMK